jgi:prepilin-type N-terminal cleavage/methylation domain-containing protein
MKNRRNEAGFSLVEVLCAMLILGVALVVMTQGLSVALASSKESELQTAAALIAAGRIETLRVEGEYDNGETEGDCGDDLPNYAWKQTISSTRTDGLHDVVVDVEKANSEVVIYELHTLLFDPGDATLVDQTNAKQTTQSQAKKRRQRNQ